ncbi:efflux transporter outer membrane subunit [Legionella sp.]|uniref:efflux transporter outer membrane subunit n=1 Tax=Legionella sp. TaxID=459 RepID=UPI00321FF118
MISVWVKRFNSCLFILLTLSVSGCKLGPNFLRPPPPAVNRYTDQPIPLRTASAPTTAGKSQCFFINKDIPAEWWEIFHSETLNQLIKEALLTNPDLRAADAGLRIAQETALAQRAVFWPRVDANLNVTRQETAHTLTPVVSTNSFFYTLITPQLTVSYVPDVFGLNRRQVESLEAQVASEVFQREALALTITTNIVMAVVQEASLRAQIQATLRSIAIGKEQLRLLRIEHNTGEIGLEGVAAQEAALAQLETNLPPLQKQLAQQHHLISVLCGHFPSEILLKFDLNKLHLPSELPFSVPAALVEQRPDIRAAESQIHAASALIGVAIAQRFPNIVLTATGGSAALTPEMLFNTNTLFYALTGNVAQTVFAAGMLKHKQRAAVAAFKQADAQYRSVVLSAFQDVADTLKAIQFDATNLRAAQKAVQATRRSLSIAQQQWKAGEVGYLEVLNAEQAYQQALITLIQNQANRFVDTAALYQALGGGWWNRGAIKTTTIVQRDHCAEKPKRG